MISLFPLLSSLLGEPYLNEQSVLPFYTQFGPLTDPGEYGSLLASLPEEPSELVSILQNLVTHIFWAQRYGIEHTEERKAEVQLRRTSEKLARIIALDNRPLNVARSLDKRLVSNCRDYAVLLAAMLRAKGIPARARCGFGTYFTPGRWEDHWVCEYWHNTAQQWIMVDAQLDAVQQEVLQIPFNPLDMAPGHFVLAGEAWQLCRSGQADPDKFGIFQWHGWDFIRGNVFREVLSLNKIELLPWDSWGILQTSLSSEPESSWRLVDRAAELTLHLNECFEELQLFYTGQTELHPPASWL
jgi:hypothetical protein